MPSRRTDRPPARSAKAPPDAAPERDFYPYPDDSADRRRLRAAIAVAAVAHLLLFALPTLRTAAQAPPEEERAMVVIQQVRFKPPPPPPPEAPPPEPQAVEIPVPDPTPDELEPIRQIDEIVPLEQPIDYGDWIAEIPPPPPLPDTGPILVGGDVARPTGIYTPLPAYTELARRVRIEGIVILQLTLDKQGVVQDVEVLKELPMGLTESAVKTVSTWRYEPATLNDQPVEVLMTVTVKFTLQ